MVATTIFPNGRRLPRSARPILPQPHYPQTDSPTKSRSHTPRYQPLLPNPTRSVPPLSTCLALVSPTQTLAPSAPSSSSARVRPQFSFKDAVLSPPSSPPPVLLHQTRHSTRGSGVPPSPPRFLLNPSLRGRCFRCFLRGHRAAICREPRRCLLCMNVGHPASRCRSRSPPSPMVSHPPLARRPRVGMAFIPSSPPLRGNLLYQVVWLKWKPLAHISSCYRLLFRGVLRKSSGARPRITRWRASTLHRVRCFSRAGCQGARRLVGALSALKVSNSPSLIGWKLGKQRGAGSIIRHGSNLWTGLYCARTRPM